MKEPSAIVFRIATPSIFQINLPEIREGLASYTLHSYLRERIREVFQESGTANWDDEGARAVDYQTVVAAERLAEALPMIASRPAVFALKSGKIGFQWLAKNRARDAVVVSVDDRETVTYAMSCANGKKIQGAEVFLGSIPRDVLECVLHRFVEPTKEAATAAG
jgi:hypothetical protein